MSNMPTAKCPSCGGMHFGSPCPFISSPCVVCRELTILACSDCAIDSGGRDRVHVCDQHSCRDTHEQQHPNVRQP